MRSVKIMLATMLLFTAAVSVGRGQQPGLTPVQQRVVTLALSQSGQSSGRSIYAPTGPWIADVGQGNGPTTDGAKMRIAISRYATWCWSDPRRRPPLTQVTAAMVNDLGATAYSPTSKAELVLRMITRYNTLSAANPRACVAPPANQQQTLDFLLCRPTCLEWADQIALAAGGQPRSFNGPAIAPAAQRPGMMLVEASPLGGLHAGIILEIRSNGGVPIAYRLGEANSTPPFPWSNPPGQRPWERTVRSDRWVAATSVIRILSFE